MISEAVDMSISIVYSLECSRYAVAVLIAPNDHQLACHDVSRRGVVKVPSAAELSSADSAKLRLATSRPKVQVMLGRRQLRLTTPDPICGRAGAAGTGKSLLPGVSHVNGCRLVCSIPLPPTIPLTIAIMASHC